MKDLSWKTISSEYLHKDTWFTIRVDKCETNEGKIVYPYYVYEFPTWVTAVALTEDGKIIMERQYRHAAELTNYEIPGGCVDDTDATLQDAIARELLEETGYEFSHYEYLGKTSSNPSPEPAHAQHQKFFRFYLQQPNDLVRTNESQTSNLSHLQIGKWQNLPAPDSIMHQIKKDNDCLQCLPNLYSNEFAPSIYDW